MFDFRGCMELEADVLPRKYKACPVHLDFGISTESEGGVLNEGLLSYSEEGAFLFKRPLSLRQGCSSRW